MPESAEIMVHIIETPSGKDIGMLYMPNIPRVGDHVITRTRGEARKVEAVLWNLVGGDLGVKLYVTSPLEKPVL